MNTEDRQEQLDRINTEIARLEAERDAIPAPEVDAEAAKWAKVYADWLGTNCPRNYLGWCEFDTNTQRKFTSAMRHTIDGLRAEWQANAGPRRMPDGITEESLYKTFDAAYNDMPVYDARHGGDVFVIKSRAGISAVIAALGFEEESES